MPTVSRVAHALLLHSTTLSSKVLPTDSRAISKVSSKAIGKEIPTANSRVTTNSKPTANNLVMVNSNRATVSSNKATVNRNKATVNRKISASSP